MPRTKPQSQPAPASVAATNGPLGEVLTLAETAAYLRLSEQDVLIVSSMSRTFPPARSGRNGRFFKAAIQHWLSTGSPGPRSSKEALLAWAGKFKDDPDLDAIVGEIRCPQPAQRREGD